MAWLLRAKFAQHPHLAETLLATGDGRIEYTSFGSRYWNAYRGQGRNWMGGCLNWSGPSLPPSNEPALGQASDRLAAG